MRILITRPEPEASTTAADITALGHTPVLAPMLRVVEKNPLLPPIAQDMALIITSRHALTYLQRHQELQRLPLFVVGEATAGLVRSAGLRVTAVGEDIAGLRAVLPASPLLYLRGAHVQDELSNLRPVSVIAYDAQAMDHLPPDAQAAWHAGEVEVALFYSVRTAEQFMRVATPQPSTASTALALSESIAKTLRTWDWRNIIVTPQKTHGAMMQAIASMP